MSPRKKAEKPVPETKEEFEDQVKEALAEEPTPEEVPETTVPQQQAIDPNKDLKFGVLIGLKQNGDFLYEMFGTEQTVTNLMGIKSFAETRMQVDIDKKFLKGDALTHEVAKLLMQIGQKLDVLLGAVKKPDNEL